MASSSKKRLKSKSHVISESNDDSKALGEVLHRSTKTKNKTKKNKELSPPNHQIPSPDSDVEVNNQIIYRSECLCNKHFTKQLLERSYELPVDKLFDLIFGSNAFVRTYRQAQRIYDEIVTEWVTNEATGLRERTLTYKVPYESTFVGKGTIHSREKQIILNESSGSHYTLETDVFNEGVKFSDTFSLNMRYCLVQISPTMTNLLVTAQITYHKSVNGFIKQLIERNAFSATQEGLKDLNGRLNLLVDFKTKRRRSSQNEITLIVPTKETVRRMSQHDVSSIQQGLSGNNRDPQSINSDSIMYINMFLIGILFFIFMYLYMKLTQMEYLLDRIVLSLTK